MESKEIRRLEQLAASVPEFGDPKDTVSRVDRDLVSFTQVQQVSVDGIPNGVFEMRIHDYSFAREELAQARVKAGATISIATAATHRDFGNLDFARLWLQVCSLPSSEVFVC